MKLQVSFRFIAVFFFSASKITNKNHRISNMIQLALAVPFIFLVPVFARSPACTQDESTASCTSSLLSDTESYHSDSDSSDDLSYYSSSRSLHAGNPAHVCHLLGPKIIERSDKDEQEEFVPPKNYQHVFEVKLNIGFKRLRKAMLSSDSEFWSAAVLKSALQYQK